MSVQDLQVIIGLEVHIQLTNLKTKLFCSCSNDYRGKEPNTYTCPICIGLPGSLPVINKRAIEFATRLAIALECEINGANLKLYLYSLNSHEYSLKLSIVPPFCFRKKASQFLCSQAPMTICRCAAMPVITEFVRLLNEALRRHIIWQNWSICQEKKEFLRNSP